MKIAAEVGCFVIESANIEAKIDHILFLMRDGLRAQIISAAPKFPSQLRDKTRALYAILTMEPMASDAEVQSFIQEVPKDAVESIFELRNAVCHGKLAFVTWRSQGYRIRYEKVDRPGRAGGKQLIAHRTLELSSDELRQRTCSARNMIAKMEAVRLQVWSRLEGWPTLLISSDDSPFSSAEALAWMDR